MSVKKKKFVTFRVLGVFRLLNKYLRTLKISLLLNTQSFCQLAVDIFIVTRKIVLRSSDQNRENSYCIYILEIQNCVQDFKIIR